MKLYAELVSWYRVIDPYEDHLDEAIVFTAGFDKAVKPRPQTLLELGAGAGHNGFHLKQRFTCTLTDLSEAMRGLSVELNPECEHVLGDMRSMRLGRTFDAVLVHDAIMYMTSRADLRAAIETAFVHTRLGGAAIFAPDCVRDDFKDDTELLQETRGTRAMRAVQWSWDPDPSDDTHQCDYALVLREGTTTRVVHDPHTVGFFTRAVWLSLFEEVGFKVADLERPIGGGKTDMVFLCSRP